MNFRTSFRKAEKRVVKVKWGGTGFTLLEVLISISLAAIILFATYTIFFAISRTVDSVTEERKIYESGRVLMELLTRDLRGINRVGKSGLIGTREEIDEKGYSRIDFITTSLLRSGFYSEGEVGYRIVKGEEGKLILLRREGDVEGDLKTGGTYFELSKDVKEFNLSFSDGSTWFDEWDSKAMGRIPQSIRIEIKLVGENGREATFATEETVPSSF
jgi:prepilin-type N-terminal cleavage/methylation domain-containing protein